MKWLDQLVSLYYNHSDNAGRPATLREVLNSAPRRDINALIELRKIDKNMPVEKYKLLCKPWKKGLQCFTPAALLKTKAKGRMEEISRTGLLQLDFDIENVGQFDLEELKEMIFDFKFTAVASLSCSGSGIFALIQIEEPERLTEYAEHLFRIFKEHGISPDESKGKKVENLRYISTDGNLLIREDPVPLRIPKNAPVTLSAHSKVISLGSKSAPRRWAVKQIQSARSGSRWATVQKAAFTLGGYKDLVGLRQLKAAIMQTEAFAGDESKYCQCAEDCFSDGLKKPFRSPPGR